jgi:succinylglutamate desuccinylase
MKKVIIFGGTHGNEWTGVAVVKNYAESLKEEFKDLDLTFILANPIAHELNQRFKDEDLNRAFQYLQEDRPHSFENQRARELKDLITKGPCFIIDLHTTTSNMGKTLIISHDHSLNFQISNEVLKKVSETRVILSPDPHRKYLASKSETGLMIEVGPIANGVIDASVLEDTIEILKEILSSLSTPPTLTSGSLEIYEEIEDVFYPQNDVGELKAFVHKDFQGKDFIPVKGKYIPFRSFQNEDITLKTEETLFPIFINEAAYYPKGLAYTLCRKRILQY